ncbi:MAG: hypothetical protein V3T82_09255 [Nitrospinaceae bacterium]
MFVDRKNGKIVGLYKRCRVDSEGVEIPDQEELGDASPEVAAFLLSGARNAAVSDIKDAAQAKYNDITAGISKATAKGAFDQGKAGIQKAITEAEVEQATTGALTAIAAL